MLTVCRTSQYRAIARDWWSFLGSRKWRAGTEPAPLHDGGGRAGTGTRKQRRHNTEKQKKQKKISPPKGRSQLATTEQRPLRSQLATTTATRTHTDNNHLTDTWLQRTQLTIRNQHGDTDHDDHITTPTSTLGRRVTGPSQLCMCAQRQRRRRREAAKAQPGAT